MTDKDDTADIRRNERTTSHEQSELPAQWRDKPVDPDPETHLGYEVIAWEKINVVDNPGQVIFLPDSEEQLRDDAFIVLSEGSVCDLAEQR